MNPLARALTAATLAASMPAMAAIDVYALWNYDEPAASEARFRAALDGASGDDALILRTQIARSYTGQFVKPLLDRARRQTRSANGSGGGGRSSRRERGVEAAP